jgi:hypothetical protein
MVCGSLGVQLPTEPSPNRISAKSAAIINDIAVEFAVASTSSKQCNHAFRPHWVKREALLKLVGAPGDIIHAEYVSLKSHWNLQPAGVDEISALRVIRLPWSFVEELYLAQGLILGNNPWALGGLYFGAVLSNGCFIGLTSVHPFPSHVRGCTDPRCISQHHARPQLGRAVITFDGYLRCHRHVPRVAGAEPTGENVKICRTSARINGPSHVEVYQSTFGPDPNLRTNNTLTEKSLSLGFMKDEVERARTKTHDNCDETVCEGERFGNGNHARKDHKRS